MKSPLKEPIDKLGKGLNTLVKPVWIGITKNPISNIITNTYSFFWQTPRRNLQYDKPWMLFRNNSAEFVQWYQWPHNLPPFVYMGDHPADFFCYGLPGCTLPLGNYDPFGFQLVSKKVVMKYRESELKHGRLAMLACAGFIMQEMTHPLYPNVGGMAVTHMEQLHDQPLTDSLIVRAITAVGSMGGGVLQGDLAPSTSLSSLPSLPSLLSLFSLSLPFPLPDQVGAVFSPSALSSLPHVDFTTMPDVSTILSSQFPLDYLLVVGLLANFEIRALYRNYGRWGRAEYNHQFDHNIGVANLRDDYINGDYGFDPLELMPEEALEITDMQNKELNNGRLAMFGIIGMIVQEYVTGTPVLSSALDLLPHYTSPVDLITQSFSDIGGTIDYLLHLPDAIKASIKAVEKLAPDIG
jgi:hypothetical protein